MSNMSYVRFENTAEDLEDCYVHLHDPLDEREHASRMRIIRLAKKIISSVGEENDGDMLPQEDEEE